MDSILRYRDSVHVSRTLPPDVFLERTFEPLAGPATVTITAAARLEDQTVVHDRQTGIRFTSQNVRVQVTVFDPDGSEVASDEVAVPVVGRPGLPVEFEVPPEFEARPWRVEARNVGMKEIICGASVEFVDGRVVLHSTAVPLRVLNHALRQLLLGLAMEVRLDGSQGRVTLSPDLAVVLGAPPAPIFFDLGKDVARDINMRTFTARARVRGGADDELVGPFIRLFIEFETIGETEVEFHGVDLAQLSEATIEVDVRLRTEPGARGIGRIVPGFFLRANIGLRKTAAGSFASGVKDAFGGSSFDETIAEAVRSLDATLALEVAPLVAPYLTEGFLQLASRTDVLHDLVLEGDAFVVRHFDPTARPGPLQDVDDVPLVVDPTGGIDPSDHGLPGGDPALDRLANIETFVILMLENRSFDHVLGYLSLTGGRPDVDGLRGNERNEAPGGLVNGINHLQDTVFGLSPAHEIGPVMSQIADGEMSGFLTSFVDRYPFASLGEDDPLRESPLSYYAAEQLPAFDVLADEYLVCDRWFCSFPGATQPNRFCTLSGDTPVLSNLSLDDPRVGYLTDDTIFDLLPRNVDWVYFEHDVSSLRFYDRYRLDDEHVIPFHDPRDGFHTRARTGRLPPVVFIDPDFVDVPFGAVANDDHPPADMTDGQRLVATIYNRLVGCPQWPNMLFVITYDEHGGFFDHVAPPGTRRASEDAIAVGEPARDVAAARPGTRRASEDATTAGAPVRNVAAVHPDGPTSLGVRVPTLVVSPWVAAGGVSSVVFDHTSIGKSILQRFGGEDARIPSRRMRGARHLGHLLATERRTDRPHIPPIDPPTKPPPDRDIPDGAHEPRLVGDPDDKDDFHEIVRHFGRPLPLRRHLPLGDETIGPAPDRIAPDHPR